MLTKLKYVGLSTEELLNLYILFIRSITEYCSVVFHSSLTQELTYKIERIQKTCLKVILSDNYVSYQAALEMCGLDSLSERRDKRCLDFGLKAIKHKENKRFFPLNDVSNNEHAIINREVFIVKIMIIPSWWKSSS